GSCRSRRCRGPLRLRSGQAFDSVRLAPLFAQDDIWKRFVSDLEISRFLLFLSFFFSSLPPSSKSFFRSDSYNPSHKLFVPCKLQAIWNDHSRRGVHPMPRTGSPL